ncbi:hypothetical protein V5O48_016745 [Marasmius crinis-equi]|uniref:Uncharacterized protein n=1 Tax=Marasmius crinis-equi TaxID=585013 RepID=A0ABR3ER02_9AGAR
MCPLPARKDTSFKLKLDTALKAMRGKALHSYKVKFKHFNMTEGEHSMEMVKNWFQWQLGKLKDYGPFKTFLKELETP